jgi:enoyl-CoA hydratase
MILVERVEGTAVVRLSHGKVSALDAELCAAIAGYFRALASDPSVDAVVLTGSGSCFSAGVDLRRALKDGPEATLAMVQALDEALEAVFDLPKPCVAALNGHAIAGGYILAAACDRRVMANGGGRVAAPELAVGVPFPWIALEILRAAVPSSALRELVLDARTFSATDAHARGLVDALVEPEGLAARAVEIAGRLSGPSKPAFALAKAQLRRFSRNDEVRRRAHDEAARALWASPATRAAVEAYLEKVGGGGK